MAWTTPKTNWIGSDTFSASDWLRIVGNLKYIADRLSIAYTPYTSVTDGNTVLTSADRNVVTDLIDEIYISIGAAWSRGYVNRRKDYGSAWNSKDLNIIESLLLNIKAQLDGTITSGVEYYAGEEIICGDTISVGLL